MLQKLALEGDEIASYNLALLLLSGLGVNKDNAKARELFKQSSDKGWKAAAEMLANDKLPEGPSVLNQWTPYFMTDEKGEIQV
jgi:TPR repeat protein